MESQQKDQAQALSPVEFFESPSKINRKSLADDNDISSCSSSSSIPSLSGLQTERAKNDQRPQLVGNRSFVDGHQHDDMAGPSTGRKASVSLMLFRETNSSHQDNHSKNLARVRPEMTTQRSTGNPQVTPRGCETWSEDEDDEFRGLSGSSHTRPLNGPKRPASRRPQKSDHVSKDGETATTGAEKDLESTNRTGTLESNSGKYSFPKHPVLIPEDTTSHPVVMSNGPHRLRDAGTHVMEFERAESEVDYASTLSTFTSDSGSSEEGSEATENDDDQAIDLVSNSLNDFELNTPDHFHQEGGHYAQDTGISRRPGIKGKATMEVTDSKASQSEAHKVYPLLSNVVLRPFNNQVGGHSSMFRMGRRAVCKPLVRQENAFYEKLEQTEQGRALLCFVPQYLGVLNVTYKRRPTGSDEDRAGGHSDEDRAIPQVAFDHNRHIIPSWMMALSQSRPQSQRSSPTENTTPSYRQRIRHNLQTQQSVHDRPPSLDLNEIIKSKNKVREARVRLTSDSMRSDTHSDPDDSVKNTCAFLSRKHGSSHEDNFPDNIPSSSPLGTPPMQTERLSTSNDSASEIFINRIRGLGTTIVNRRLKEQVLREAFAPRSGSPRSAGKGGLHQSFTGLLPKGHLCGGRRRLSSASDLMVDRSSKSTPQRSRRSSPVRDAGIAPVLEDEDLFTFDDLARQGDGPITLGPSAIPKEIVHENGGDERFEQFILLEDLSGRLKSPCVLDLKMGTRQYGIDATDAKKASQTAKCQKTTSRTLGVRLCGMQIFKVSTKKYLFQDKYYGRSLTTQDFRRALGGFLDNGTHMLVHHVPVILRKLHRLAEIVYDLKGYRFYASSLLFLYDGDEAAQISQGQLQAHAREQQMRLEALNQHSNTSAPASPVLAPFQPHSHCHRGEMNIKIIDFAHCATGDPAEFSKEDWRFPPKHADRPDLGYLWGLKSLCESFLGIWQDELENRLINARGPSENDTILTRGGVAEDQDMLDSIREEGVLIWSRMFANPSIDQIWQGKQSTSA